MGVNTRRRGPTLAGLGRAGFADLLSWNALSSLVRAFLGATRVATRDEGGVAGVAHRPGAASATDLGEKHRPARPGGNGSPKRTKGGYAAMEGSASGPVPLLAQADVHLPNDPEQLLHVHIHLGRIAEVLVGTADQRNQGPLDDGDLLSE